MPDRGTPSILKRILADTRAEVARRQQKCPPLEMVRRAQESPRPRDFAAALGAEGLSLIAEFKRASPSKGDIFPDAIPAEVAVGYVEGGARAMSILTDGPYFKGSEDDLRSVRASVDVPLLRKDFTVDSYQIYEARAIGADAVLLIVAAVTDDELSEMIGVAHDLGLAALVETHTAEEVDRAVAAGARIIGVNNRDLHTFVTLLDTTFALIERIPDGVLVVSESGIATHDDAAQLQAAGADAILVGESMMRAASSIVAQCAREYQVKLADQVRLLLNG